MKSSNENILGIANNINRTEEELDKMFFAPARKVEAKECMPFCSFCAYNSHMIFVQNPFTDSDVVVNHVSENYLLVQNSELFIPLEKEMKERFGEFKIVREIKNTSSFFVDYIFNSDSSRKMLLGKKEYFYPRIFIQNSYNSRHLYKMSAGLYRESDNNFISIPTEYSIAVDLSHSMGNINAIIKETIDGIVTVLDKSNELLQPFVELCDRKVPKSEIKDIIEKILDDTKVMKSFKEEIVEKVVNDNKTARTKVSLYSIYSGINHLMQPKNNSKLTASFDIRSKQDQKVLDYIMDIEV